LRSLRSPASGETVGMRTCRPRPAPVPRSALAGFRFPPDVIILAVRWYLRFGLSYRDAEELLAERGVEVDHVTVYRSVQRFTPLLADAARPCRHAVGDCWWADETVRHEVRCDRTGGRSPPLGCRSSLVKLGRLTLEVQGRVGAALTTTGRVGTARRPGSGKQGGTAYECRNQG
jgi:hypothetical protein